MLHFTLGPRRELDPAVDEMERTWNGYDPQASPQALYDVNRSCWVLGRREGGSQRAGTGGVVGFWA